MSDQYESLAEHLVCELRRFVPLNARITLHLRGPEIESGGPANELAITWEMPADTEAEKEE